MIIGVELLFLAITTAGLKKPADRLTVSRPKAEMYRRWPWRCGVYSKEEEKRMRKLKKLRVLLVIVLVFALVVPQGVFASPAKLLGKIGALRGLAEMGPRLKTGGYKTEGLKPDYRLGEVIFKPVGDTAGILKKYRLNLLRRDQRIGYILASAPVGTDIDKLITDLEKDKSVQYAQPNYIYKLSARPNDPQYSRQWALPKIYAESGWGVARSNSAVTIAILDSGVDVNHPDLKGRLVSGTNTVNPLKSTRDDAGHGTHVAGIIGAAVNNGLGVAGVAGIAGVKIMPVKVFDQWGGSDISISDGITWAADHGAKVMNMSFGSFYRSKVLNDAIDYAYGKGIVMVAAAGNWASEEISYPAAVAKVIAVSALNKNDKLADFSSFGPQIDVSAPGEEIYSTYWDSYKGSTYTELSGTSMASPMVAGLAALLLAKNPKLTNDDVRQIIEVSATDLGDPGWDPQYGHGKINVYRALTMSLAKQDDSNSTVQKAVYLTNGIAFREKINSGNDVDWYKVALPANSHLQVEVLPAGKVSPGVEIYDSAGETISSFNTPSGTVGDWSGLFGPLGGSTIKVAQAVYGMANNLDEGEYFIKVFGNHFRWSEENYTITARVFTDTDLVKDSHEPNDSYEQARNIELGAVITGAILSSGEEDWFKINLNGGQAYKIHADVPAGLDLAIDIENEANFQEPASEEQWKDFYELQYWATVNNGGQGEDEDGVIVVPQNSGGQYYVRVYETGGTAVNANYTVGITGFDFRPDKYEPNNTFEQAAAINLGEEITANFHQEDDEDWYSIEVPNTGILKFDLHQPSKVWCDLEIYSDPKAEPEGTSRFDSGFGIRNNDYSGFDQKERSFEFKVAKGRYFVKITNSGSVSADNYIIKAGFNTFDFVDDEINDSPLKAKEITMGFPTTGTLYPDGDVDFYVLNVDKPQPVLVFLTPPAGLDTALTVFKETESDNGEEGNKGKIGENLIDKILGGEELPANSGPLLEPLTEINSGEKGYPDAGVFVASKPGKYYLMVVALGDRYQGKSQTKSPGKYSLDVKPFKVRPDVWEYNNTLALAKPLTSGVAVRPTFMGIEDTDWYKVNVPGKGKLKINLTVPSDIDGVLEIYDAAGKLLCKIDQSMVGEEESIELPVSKKGYYYIKTYDYLGNSSVQTYTLTARYTK